MSSISRSAHLFFAARCAGVKGTDGGQYGGTYHPPFVNAAGKQVSSRWEGNFFLNNPGFVDANGQPVEGAKDVIRLTAWSGKNPTPKGGPAESFARFMTPGLECSFQARLQTYDGRVFDGQTPLVRPDGSFITVRKVGFVYQPGTLIIGEESEKFRMTEVLKFQQSGGRFGRPAQWFNRAHPDYQIWQGITKVRQSEIYVPGKPVFGYALVAVPKGAAAGTAYPGMGMGMAPNPAMLAAMMNGGMNMGGGAVEPVKVGGYTLAQWRTGGLTDQMIMSNPNFAAFIPELNAARAMGAGAGNMNMGFNGMNMGFNGNPNPGAGAFDMNAASAV